MGEILNLDELLPEEKFITFQGERHVFEGNSTETYLKIVQARKKLMKAGVDAEDEEEQIKFSVEMIALALPTIPRQTLLKLGLKANMKLMEVIQKEMEREMSEDQPAGEGGPPAGEPTSPELSLA